MWKKQSIFSNILKLILVCLKMDFIQKSILLDNFQPHLNYPAKMMV